MSAGGGSADANPFAFIKDMLVKLRSRGVPVKVMMNRNDNQNQLP